MKFTLIAPPSREMPPYLLDLVARNGHVIEQTQSLEEGLRGADVVYATCIQKERFAGEEIESYMPEVQIRKALVDTLCKPDTILMHPLPRDGRPDANDLSVDLNRDPRLAIVRQTDNGIPVLGAVRGADGRGAPGGALDARCGLALARAHRAGQYGLRQVGLTPQRPGRRRLQVPHDIEGQRCPATRGDASMRQAPTVQAGAATQYENGTGQQRDQIGSMNRRPDNRCPIGP